MLTLVMMLTTFAASAVTFTVKVGNPAAVTCTVNGSIKELTESNDFDVAENTSIKFTGVAPYYITSVVNHIGTPASGYYNGDWYFSPSSYDEGEVFTIVTTNLDDNRNATFTLNIDDPTLVRAQLSGYNTTLDLQPGGNPVKFDEVTEQYLYLSSTDYSKPLYEVKLGDEKLEAQSGGYTVPLTDGCTVDVTAIIPDIDITVTFNYTTDEAIGAIKTVYVDGQEATGFDGTSLTMKAGQTLGLSSDSNYKINSVTINGTATNWTGGYTYTQTLIADATVDVDARPYGTISATIIIDDPTNIVLYRGYAYQNDIIELVPGDNPIELLETNTTISWKAADGCLITSVTAGSESLSEYTTQYTVTDGMTITFVTDKIVMDKTVAVWANDISKANYYFNFQGNDHSNIPLENGYNIVPFYEKMTPFQVGWAGQDLTVSEVYLNGEQVDPRFTGSTTWELPIEDGDVLKIFIGEEPVACDVSFTADDEIEAGVVRDIITEVTDWRSGFSCFGGTEVTVTGSGIKVSVNGTEIDADDEDNFTFTVSEATTEVKIENKEGSAVEDIAIDNAGDDAPVYNLNGIRVATRATAGNLPAGIYVTDGQKYIVK